MKAAWKKNLRPNSPVDKRPSDLVGLLEMARVPKSWLSRVSRETAAIIRRVPSDGGRIILDNVITTIARYPDAVVRKTFEIYDDERERSGDFRDPIRIILMILKGAGGIHLTVKMLLQSVAKQRPNTLIEPIDILAWALCGSAVGRGRLRRKVLAAGVDLDVLEKSIEEARHHSPPSGATDQSSDFRVWIDPGDATVDQVRDVLAALSDLNRACGGNGLIFAHDNSQQPIISCLA